MNQNNDSDPKKIIGSPTKDLFVYILTRDLSVEDAINDLIDNCIDGAKRLRSDGNYENLFIKIAVDESKFTIEDNCGGIPIDVARTYAFRFGRPQGVEKTDFSIGQFGVGMKRAFFKMGEGFYVESRSKHSEFAILVTIEDWLNQKDEAGNDDWSFEFQEDFHENQNNEESKTGTKIEISPLHPEISNYVGQTSFIDDLKSKIEFIHMENIHHGISIYVNEEKLKCIRPEFLVSDEIKVAEFIKNFENGVMMKILCGIGTPTEDKGGWYIFCNDRMLLGPEQTELTGWTGQGGGGVATYHQQFWRFRGIVHFRSEDSFKLPWNTSKNYIDISSSIFLFARGKMIEMMKPVITLLNSLKKDNETNSDGTEKTYKPYQAMVAKAEVKTIENISEYIVSGNFKLPTVTYPKENFEEFVTIAYKKPKSLADKLKQRTKSNSYSKLGEYTFDYFMDLENIDYE